MGLLPVFTVGLRGLFPVLSVIPGLFLVYSCQNPGKSPMVGDIPVIKLINVVIPGLFLFLTFLTVSHIPDDYPGYSPRVREELERRGGENSENQ